MGRGGRSGDDEDDGGGGGRGRRERAAAAVALCCCCCCCPPPRPMPRTICLAILIRACEGKKKERRGKKGKFSGRRRVSHPRLLFGRWRKQKKKRKKKEKISSIEIKNSPVQLGSPRRRRPRAGGRARAGRRRRRASAAAVVVEVRVEVEGGGGRGRKGGEKVEENFCRAGMRWPDKRLLISVVILFREPLGFPCPGALSTLRTHTLLPSIGEGKKEEEEEAAAAEAATMLRGSFASSPSREPPTNPPRAGPSERTLGAASRPQHKLGALLVPASEGRWERSGSDIFSCRQSRPERL